MAGGATSGPELGGQSYVESLPDRALRGLVSSAWIQRVGRESEPYVQRQIPNGTVELRCMVGGEPQVVGPLTAPQVEVLEPGTTVVGARFLPGAAPTVTGLPTTEIVALALDAEELWGRSAAALG
jgi:hypothetical protein